VQPYAWTCTVYGRRPPLRGGAVIGGLCTVSTTACIGRPGRFIAVRYQVSAVIDGVSKGNGRRSPPIVLASTRFPTPKPRLAYTPGAIGGTSLSRRPRQDGASASNELTKAGYGPK
jgi:hypothetical protein